MTMLTVEFRAMGSRARALVDSSSDSARRAIAALPAWFEAREQCLSRFRCDSALSRLNATGELAFADDVLWSVVGAALAGAESTGGIVTPTVLPALEAAGYDRSFERVNATDMEPALAIACPPAAEAVRRTPGARSIHLGPGVRLDLGGVAKGWCADHAARALGRFGASLVDVGGDIAMAGPLPREPWPIAIGDPGPIGSAKAAEPLALALLSAGGIATSGRDFRRWTRGGGSAHHIIDPRTGRPADTDVLAATVIGPSALAAEIAAKCVLVLGSDAGWRWVEAQPALATLLVKADGTVLRSPRMERHLWRE